MSKIIQAINVMVSKHQKITGVVASVRDCDHLYFLYDEKYKWSVERTESNEHYLRYYPGPTSIDEMAIQDAEPPYYGWEEVAYSSETLKSREASESLRALWGAVRGKRWEMDDVLDDIIEA